MLPHFLCVGAQKSGTTSLHALLGSHPQVFLPPAKELQFFSLYHERGTPWYRDQFEAAGEHQICGEITPYYLFHPLAAQRIKDLLPQVRLIVLLRDPVQRALSGLFHSIRLGVEPLPLQQALAAESQRLAGAEAQLLAGLRHHHSHQMHSYVSRSCYGAQLARYESLFDCSQLLLIRAEDFFCAPQRIWPQLLDFLGLDPYPLPQVLPRQNAGAGEAAMVSSDVLLDLRSRLDSTYALMADRYGLSWSDL